MVHQKWNSSAIQVISVIKEIELIIMITAEAKDVKGQRN